MDREKSKECCATSETGDLTLHNDIIIIMYFFLFFFFTIEVLSVLHREGGSKGQGGDWGHWTEEPHRRPRLPSGWQGVHPLEGNSSAHPKRTADYDKMH